MNSHKYHTEHHEEQDEGEDASSSLLQLQTRVILHLQADNLPRWGVRRGAPDTYALVKTRGDTCINSSDAQQDHEQANQFKRTEIVYQSCQPQWATSFPLDFEFGSKRRIFVRVVRVIGANKRGGSDDSDHSSTVTQQLEEDILGDAIFDIGDVLGSFNHTKVKRFPNGGIVLCRLEPIATHNGNSQHRICRFQFAARSLSIVSRGGRTRRSQGSNAPTTIFQISKKHAIQGGYQRGEWTTVYRSQPVSNSLNPTWDTGELDVVSLCSGDSNRPLRISVWTVQGSALGTMVGEFETTWRTILDTQGTHSRRTNAESEICQQGFPLQMLQKNDTPALVGRLLVKVAQEVVNASSNDQIGNNGESAPLATDVYEDTMVDQPFTINIGALPTPLAAPVTFQDYMQSWKLELAVAIDFTSSNGDPRIPGSLHDRNPVSFNDYEETMVAIGNAVTPYSSEGLLETHVWGFGCRFGDEVRHLFQCGSLPIHQGVDGILKAYREVLDGELCMSGPTCFDKVLRAAAAQAHRNRQGAVQVYTVLLIITDGICQDMEEAKRLLRTYSSVPLSVIFVGVGRQDFGAMEELIASSSDSRSNATFAEFRRHQHDPTSLGRSALQGLPSQLVQYMLQNKILP